MGIHDRDYMRPAAPESLFRRLARLSPATQLIVVLVIAYLIQAAAISAHHGAWLYTNLALSGNAIHAWKIWTPVTASFLHGGILHLGCNAIGIWCLGRALARECGVKRFWQVYFGGVLAGGLATAALWAMPAAWVNPEVIASPYSRDLVPTVGASAGVLALLGYFLADKLKEVLSLLIYFVIPVRLEGYWIVGVTGVLSLVGLIFTEIPAATGWWSVGIHDTSVSHSAHLGGLLLGFGWARLAMRRGESASRVIGYPAASPDEEPKPLDKSAYARLAPGPAKTAPEAPAGDMRGEVDRILDKINARGFGSLTPKERAVLEKAREALGRR